MVFSISIPCASDFSRSFTVAQVDFLLDNSVYGVHTYTMNSEQIMKRLKKEDFDHTHTKGDHWKFKKAGRIVVVPHPKKDIPTGTLRNIYRQAGWEWR